MEFREIDARLANSGNSRRLANSLRFVLQLLQSTIGAMWPPSKEETRVRERESCFNYSYVSLFHVHTLIHASEQSWRMCGKTLPGDNSASYGYRVQLAGLVRLCLITESEVYCSTLVRIFTRTKVPRAFLGFEGSSVECTIFTVLNVSPSHTFQCSPTCIEIPEE